MTLAIEQVESAVFFKILKFKKEMVFGVQCFQTVAM
jgi:hypothetical protein